MTYPTANSQPPMQRPVPAQSAWLVADDTTVAPGFAMLITASVSGTVTLTLSDGTSTVIVTVPVGDSIYPFCVTKRVAGTATVTRAYNLA